MNEAAAHFHSTFIFSCVTGDARGQTSGLVRMTEGNSLGALGSPAQSQLWGLVAIFARVMDHNIRAV